MPDEPSLSGPGPDESTARPPASGDLLFPAMSRVVAALYAFAADPDRWDELVDVLADLPEQSTLSAEVASALTPHLAQAVQIAERLSPDVPPAALPLCGLVLDAERRLLRTLGDPAGLPEQLVSTIQPGARLRFLDSENEARLRAAIAELTPVNGSSLLQLYDGADRALRLAVVVRVDAARRHQLGLAPGDPLPPAGAVAILLPAGSPAIRSDNLLRDGFGLTLAETRLVRRLEEGLSLQEAAESLGIRLNTARNQLKSVFDKMGVRRQSELVRHLMELATIARYVPATATGADARIAARRTPGDRATPEVPLTHVLPDGRHLTYRRYGRPGGRPAVVMHMWGGGSLLPPDTASVAERLDLDLLALSRPGYDGATPVADVNLRDHAHDLVHLFDALGIASAQLLAMSAGATFALGAALTHADRVERLFLVTPRPPGRDNWRGGERTGWHHFRDYLVRFPGVTDAMSGIISRTMTRESIARTVRRLEQGCAKDQRFFREQPEQFDYLVDLMFAAVKRSMPGMRDELKYSARDEQLDLAALAVPLTVWHDEIDPVIPAEAFRQCLPPGLAVDMRLFDGPGHYLWVRRWHDILRALAEWQPASAVRPDDSRLTVPVG